MANHLSDIENGAGKWADDTKSLARARTSLEIVLVYAIVLRDKEAEAFQDRAADASPIEHTQHAESLCELGYIEGCLDAAVAAINLLIPAKE